MMAAAMKTPFKSYDRLKQSGMTEAQARSVVEAIEESEEFSFKNLATKSDLLLTKTELQKEMAELKTDLRQEMAELKIELKQDIAEVKQDIVELKSDMKGVKASMQSFHTLFVSGFFVILAGMVLSYFHH